MNYAKGALSVADQIAQLQYRGLQIADIPLATHYLTHISYYRLAGYWWPLQNDKTTHTFKPRSTFEQVIDIYNFDRELRMLIFDDIERIEIAVRTLMIYELSHEFDPWWFENSTIFKDAGIFNRNLGIIDVELQHTKEVFIREHYRIYSTDPRRPPAWKTLELLSLGQISKIYGNLLPRAKSIDTIAVKLGIPNHTYLKSWLQGITQLRNLCAHHSRIWNKLLPAAYKLVKKPALPWISKLPAQMQKPYLTLCCMKYMLHSVSPRNSLTIKLLQLFEKYPTVDPAALGFPENWESEPLWKA